MEKKLKIGCFVYTVFFQPSDGDNHGSTDTDEKTIFIDSNRPIQVKRETLLHEIMHACFEDCPSFKLDYSSADDREEDIIRFCSPRLLQVLRDNKWLSEYILGGK